MRQFSVRGKGKRQRRRGSRNGAFTFLVVSCERPSARSPMAGDLLIWNGSADLSSAEHHCHGTSSSLRLR
ncbi:hypothetical protein DPMN_092593 [Dreissena polymorpha]|uniref:Uncharacterized protein n=1 Tax=Dreissena polymorpha TaxID=45954 RepID=A0A9D4R151_DREPO|nr:hypothetical protein DPMN_092593 [Dreissena polymorpha]